MLNFRDDIYSHQGKNSGKKENWQYKNQNQKSYIKHDINKGYNLKEFNFL